MLHSPKAGRRFGEKGNASSNTFLACDPSNLDPYHIDAARRSIHRLEDCVAPSTRCEASNQIGKVWR